MKKLPRGTLKMSTPLRCSSTSSAPGAPYLNPDTTVTGVAHLHSIVHADIGREGSGWGMTAFWRRIADEPGAFPPEF